MCCIGVTLCTKKVLGLGQRTRGSLAREFSSDRLKNKVNSSDLINK